MDIARLTAALSPLIGVELASDLVSDFLKIRQDYSTRTLERATSGKFVETVVQCLQQIATGLHDARPTVDSYLQRVENDAALPEQLRICVPRVARAIYTFRNKRNVAHKGEVDPNTIDLAFAHHGSAWILSELLRGATGLSMQEAGDLITLVQTPVGTLVEEIGGVPIVLADVSVRSELLILLHSRYPTALTQAQALKSLSRRSAGTVKNRLRDLHNEKLAQGSAKDGYRLTRSGYDEAVAEVAAQTQGTVS
jgi:hypothetical protein